MIRIRSVTPLDHFRVRIELTNGKQKTIDLKPYLHGPIFEPLRKNLSLFNTVKVDKELGTIVWENGADIDPDVLVGNAIPEWLEEAPLKKSALHVEKSMVIKEPKAPYRVRKRKK